MYKAMRKQYTCAENHAETGINPNLVHSRFLGLSSHFEFCLGVWIKYLRSAHKFKIGKFKLCRYLYIRR
jgi:hypothetical protein